MVKFLYSTFSRNEQRMEIKSNGSVNSGTKTNVVVSLAEQQNHVLAVFIESQSWETKNL
jgi:hypothetical protein